MTQPHITDTGAQPTRRRIRRTAVALALAGVVAAGVGACQVQPGAAAFVGNDRITQDQVDTLYDGVVAEVHRVPSVGSKGLRQRIATDLVMHELSRRVVADRGIDAPPVDYRAASRRIGLKKSNKFVRVEAEAYNNVNAIGKDVAPAKPTDKDYRAIYRSLLDQGVDRRQLSYRDVRAQLAKIPNLGKVVGVHNVLVSAAHKYHVDVNPVYGTIAWPLLVTPSSTVQVLLPVQLGKGSPTVVTPPSGAVDTNPSVRG